MSILIKNMTKPKDCYDCFFSDDELGCFFFTHDCPLVEVQEPNWIPVTENTLPQKGKVVVVCGEKGTWDYGTYRGHGDDIHYWHWKKNTYKHVYWWMYKEDALPIPYKGDK